jgi:hypothetical protein
VKVVQCLTLGELTTAAREAVEAGLRGAGAVKVKHATEWSLKHNEYVTVSLGYVPERALVRYESGRRRK